MADFEALVDDLERTYRETQERMSDPAVYGDRREGAEVGRRLKELEGPHQLAEEWRRIRDDLADARGDGDLRELVPELEERLAELEEELKLALVASDPADRKDVIVEVRSGVGGDEAALWADDVFRMLTRYAERLGYKWETISANPNEGGGLKEVVFAVKGDGAYSVFKWEGGTHRVQRVPQTESQGLQNREKAMRVLRARLFELERERQEAELTAVRRAQVGTGERAEKIRTYNYAEGRVTDHRIKLTQHRLDQILEGDLGEFTAALTSEDRRRALETVA